MDRASLQWVRADVDESLKQARVNLEAYAADQADVHRMLECAETLHGVQGVLEMLEVYGVSLLLDELERLCSAVHQGEVTRRDDACEVVMQGIVQVPFYLDFIARGHPDNPIVLMPILNDVRSVRGQPLLSENALFNPDLSAVLPMRPRPLARTGDDFVAHVRKLRPHFQRGLVSWFRGDDPHVALQTIEAVLAHVQKLIGSTPSSRLWWVARAITDALLAGGLEPSTSVKQLVGQLDRLLRQFIREGEQATQNTGSPELLKNLLYYCAQARPGGKRLEAIRTAFGLDELVSRADPAESSAGRLFGPDLDTMGTVSTALKDLLARVEDALDRFNRSGNAAAFELKPLLGLLQQVGDTLGLLGLGVPRRTVVEQHRIIAALVERDELPAEGQLMDVAAALLDVDKVLDTLAGRGVDRAISDPLPHVTDTSSTADYRSGIEYLQLITSVVGEAKTDIKVIKDAIGAFVADRDAHDRLAEIPKRVSEVSGGLKMLHLEPAASLIERWMAYVQEVLLEGGDVPPDDVLDALADGIESLDYYLESIASASPDGDARLAHATACIEALPVPGLTLPPADRDGEGGFETMVMDRSALVTPEMLATAVERIPPTQVPVVGSSPDGDPESAGGERVSGPEAGSGSADESSPVPDALAASERGNDFAQSTAMGAGALEKGVLEDVVKEDDAPQGSIPVGELAEMTAADLAARAEATTDSLEVPEEIIAEDTPRESQAVKIDGRSDDSVEVDEDAEDVVMSGGAAADAEQEIADAAALAEAGGVEVDEIEYGDEDEITITGADGPIDADFIEPEIVATGLDPAAFDCPGPEVASPEVINSELVGSGVIDSGVAGIEVAEDSSQTDDDDPAGILAAAAALAGFTSLRGGDEERSNDGASTSRNEDASRPASETSVRQDDEIDDVAYVEFPMPGLLDSPTAGEQDDEPGPIPDAVARSLMEASELLARMDDDARHEASSRAEAAVDDQRHDDELRRSLASMEEAAITAGDGVANASAALAGGPLGDDIDSEIVEVFLEEGDEVMEVLAQAMPRWAADWNDMPSMTEVRRGFHTLKGSGRMVGAFDIGEFSWAVENMLNRVIDGIVPISGPVVGLVDEAVASLPALFAELRGEGTSGVDVDELGRRAQALAEASAVSDVAESRQFVAPIEEGVEKVVEAGDCAGEASPEGASALSDEPGAEAPYEPPGRFGADILTFPKRPDTPAGGVAAPADQVFLDEAVEHLDAIGALVGQAVTAPHEYVRHFHTLKGGTRSFGLTDAGAVCEACENMLGSLVDVGIVLDGDAVSFLGGARESLREAIEGVRTAGDSTITNLDALVSDCRSQHERLRALDTEASSTVDLDELLAERAELRDTFLEEAAEILDTYDSVLERWRANGPSRPLLDELQRGLHTLKGGARMAQLTRIGDLSHSLETITAMAVGEQLEVGPALFDVVEATQDALADMLDCVVAYQPIESPDALIERINALASGKPMPDVDAEDRGEVAAAPLDANLAAAGTGAGGESEDSDELAPERGERISVDAELLDNLTGFAGEISISQSRIEQQVGAFRANLEEMDQTVSRLREQLRRLELETESQIIYRREREGVREIDDEFDPLEFDRFSRMQELSRGLAESVGDLSNIRDMLNGLTRESEGILIQQARTNTDLQHGLTQTRMLPFARLVPRLRRVVRQTARDTGKRARLEVSGDDIRIDRTVLNRMSGAFEHLLRNSVDHGIEDVRTRTLAGKPAEGMVRLDIVRDGAEVRLTLSDDGVGVSLDAVRERAIERGLVAVGSDVADEEVLQFVFEPAFSTRTAVTQISGRGVGLDVVRNDVKQLGGTVRVTSGHGRGSQFILQLPLTLAINQALMVQVGAEELGLPLGNVDAVVRLRADQAERLETSPEPYFEHTGLRYPFVYLGAALGVAEASYHQDRYPVVLMRAGDDRVAIRVDELRGRKEVVVKAVGPMLSAIRWISGATIMGDGRVILILDAPTLARLALSGSAARATGPGHGAREAEAEGAGPTVMVVDDSITVRKVTGRFLQRNGMTVLTAKDGVEALALLQEVVPDVMLLDIEMPRMDGFELATTIRNDARLRALPIIMITSRTGEKHNQRASQIGVDRYLGKPFHEGELLDNIKTLLAEGA